METNILTTTLTNETAPELLRNEIDSRIVKIRPSSTPLDQISRLGSARRAGSMRVEYYSVDTKEVPPLTKQSVPSLSNRANLSLSKSTTAPFSPKPRQC